uniref:DH domain-containing protein n=1 Tax=Strigamia maritima TaxID=126957 RepID=T1IIA5_STRMM
MTSTLRSIQEILEMEADSKTDSVEREALRKRAQVVKELIETEEEFARDMLHVVKTYLRDLDNPRVPKEIRDLRDAIFINFEQISDFHN